jgi:hypothetical protein
MAAGAHCVSGECRPCKGDTEICNGLDDDCDGVVDEGQDADGDGFTWCGALIRELADCADMDPKIHPASIPGPDGKFTPAAKEECDGKDNDCDSKIDEVPECDEMRTCVQDGCTGQQRCDTTTGRCIEPRPVGDGCTSDSECAGGLCAQPSSFDLNVAENNKRCASACCVDSDCSKGSVCVVSSSGARLCFPSNIAGRSTRALGALCSADADCSSGACDRSRCVARCFSDSGCGNTTCLLGMGGLNAPRLWQCAEAQGREMVGGICSQYDLTACRSGYCSERNACGQACGRNADCDSDEICGYVRVRPLLSLNQTSLVSVCQPRGATAPDETLCCTNADCGTSKLCAPKSVDDDAFSVMSCR